MRQAIYNIKNLSIGYFNKDKSPRTVRSSINGTLWGGELTCLLGPNGAGKSTLLRSLSGFQPTISGEIEILGKKLGDYTEKELSRYIGVVLTDKCEVRNLSVYELVSMGRSPYTGFWGKLSSNDKSIIEDALKMTGMLNFKHRFLQDLSDGERQKVMIAKALVQETPVIFLDEPTAFLDLPSKVEIMQLLHRLARETGKLIFLSTHDLDLALQIADRIWLMDKGNELMIGTPEDLSLKDHFSRFFKNDGICFDNKTGLFKVINKHYREVHVSGHGFEYTLIRKALSRNGIYAHPKVKSDLRIDILKEGDIQFVVFNKDEVIEKVTNIDDLLTVMRNYN
ncbi:ABC transporter ATP-binding protein [Puteibacter caeruleilacunae]|nr:ABC transporter ATP-binding protein [Puteibacter caeruleilacunae]